MLFSSCKILLVLAIVQVAIAVPLSIEYDKTTGLTKEEQANKGRLDTAMVEANAQVAKMREGINKYKDGDAQAKVLYEASFGKKADVDEVEKTMGHLETGNFEVKLATHDYGKGGTIASVPFKYLKNPDSETRKKSGPARFSKMFHGSRMNTYGRAGTIIHEATHQLANTGDRVDNSGNIIRPLDPPVEASKHKGYTNNLNFHKSVAEVDKDKDFKEVRDSVKNMHHNAESYGLFGSLCSQPGALQRRDLHLFRRAMVNGDDDQLMYLARRNSCKLPANYFAKKAAAKKAAATGAKPYAAHGHVLGTAHTAIKGAAHGSKLPHATVPNAHGSRPAVKGGKAAPLVHGAYLTKPMTAAHAHGAKGQSQVSKARANLAKVTTSHARNPAAHLKILNKIRTSVKSRQAHSQARPKAGTTKAPATSKAKLPVVAKGKRH